MIMKQKLQFLGLLIVSFLMTGNLVAQSVFVNELHYDNLGGDTEEGIEIAGPAGTNLDGWSIVEYNGNGGVVSGTTNLSGIIPDLQGGFGTIFFPISGLQNGSPDGFALVNNLEVVQFLSYEGVLTATAGVASGLESTDIGVKEDPAPEAGFSLQLSGSGQEYQNFAWQPAASNTYNAVNTGQDFGGEVVPPTIVINEVDADTEGTDVLEFVELYDGGAGNNSLDGKVLVFYNGSNDLSYNAIDLSGYSTDANGYFVLGNTDVENVSLQFNSNGLQNGADAVALFEGSAADFPNGTAISTDNLIDALVYDTNDADDAGLLVLLNEGQSQINEDGNGNKDAHSSQRFPNGSGGVRNTDTYTQALPTPGKPNTNILEPVSLVINELDADTPGSDTQEFLELYDGGKGNTPLDGFIVVLYNGNNDLSYNTIDLAGQLTNAEGYFVMGNADVANVNMVVANNTFQNGADAVAVYQTSATNFPNGSAISTDNLVDALVYGTDDPQDEELIVLLNEGQLQADENAAGNQGIHSLQRIPNGEGGVRNTANYVATDPTPGTENGALAPQTELITILEARNALDGTTVTITGTLTVSDQFRGSAYLQDVTGGVAIFDGMVHGDGTFNIGDKITVTGTKSSYNGQIQISPVARVDFEGVADAPIIPLDITVAELSQHPGELVRITDVTFSGAGSLIFGNENYVVADDSGNGELRLDADVSGLIGKQMPASCSEVIGVVGRYNQVFQLLPRLSTDLPCAAIYDNSGSDSDISRDLTFDVVAWNIEWFGDEGNSPAKGSPDSDAVQKERVKAILLDLEADVIGVEEISDDVLFGEMVSEMEGYDYVLSNATSYPDSPGGQKVGFIYRTDVVSVKSTRAMFTSVHPFYDGDGSLLADYPETPDRFYASGRLPFMMEADVTLNGQTKTINFVELHARANGSTNSQSRYDMRKYDVEVLKDSLDTYYSDKNIIILGDYNDDVDVTVADNVNTTVTTYNAFVQDTQNYDILTAVLSAQGFRSYAFRENMIDHIAVSNELTNNYVDGSARVHYEYFNSDFTTTASDHFPVSVRMILKSVQVASIEASNVTCNGTATGSATVNVEGGVAPYTYLWSDGQTTQTATNLIAGTYTVVVTDALSNSVNAEVVVEEGPALELEMTKDVVVYAGYDTTCTSIEAVSVTGGRGEYTYLWNTGDTSKTITVCPSETTTYSLEVTDVSGCSVTGEVTVTVEDVTCGNNKWNQKVQVCYKGKAFCVSKNAVPAFLRNGGKLGSCSDNQLEVVVEKVVASPNPTRGQTTIRITASIEAQATLYLYDCRGNVVMQEAVRIKKGTIDTNINLSRYRTGIYFVRIKGENFESEVLKILKY